MTTDPTATEIETKARVETKPELVGLRWIRLPVPFKSNQDKLTLVLRNSLSGYKRAKMSS